MTKRLTSQEIEKIIERVENTTFMEAYIKGDPWKSYEVKNINTGVLIAGEVPSKTDAEFIAHARNDVPALLDDIKQLRKESYMYEQAIAEDDATKERLLDEIERLRNNIRTIETMTSCEDTRNFANRALSGNASIEI